ncbi:MULTISPECIES: HPF/RaiA family ribosome-associated protein [unclassified Flavobacterium]|uniref:HPF/RaiA family ribosome-associated protein n=1 Tax=unclassified Flavobacterium TaxID=196869 RepID=UPI003F8FD134
METTIQFVQTEKNSNAEDLVIEKLENLSNHYSWLIKAKVFFKEVKDSKGKGKICEITLSCPGPQIFASSDEETFEAAAAETIRDLQVQLNKRKADMKPY